jgi:hypothetical protein
MVMSTIKKSVHRTTAALALPRPVPALIVHAQNVVKP